MIGLDTNVLVRYLTRDDEAQYRATMKLLTRKNTSFFLADIVLMETEWVLTSIYDWTSEEVIEAFSKLLYVQNLQFENEDRIRKALKAMREGAHLSDELLVAACQKEGCREFATFDKGVIKLHPKFAFEPDE